MPGTITILAVEDDPMSLAMFQRIVLTEDYRCLTAVNGKEALSILQHHPEVDVIVLDLEMPVMSGVEMLAALKRSRRYRDIPVIVVTIDHEKVFGVLEMGANDFITKPYNPKELRLRVQNLVRTKRVTERARQAKADFVAVVSHEMRTPLNGIIGVTDFLLDADPGSQQAEYLTNIKLSANNLLNTINEVIAFSTAESGTESLQKLPFQVHDVLNRALTKCSNAAARKGIEIRLDVAPDTRENLYGFPDRITKVLVCLMENAIKFMDRGVITISASTEVLLANKLLLCCVVKDQGLGIDADSLERVFAPFVQADNLYTRRHGGIGLGLSIARRIARTMGGDIHVESEPGNGSTFTFTSKCRDLA